MEQQDIIMERNAERKERLLDIAERIGYDTAISRLQQKLSENQAALTKQNVPLDSSNFRRMQIEIAFKQEVIQALKVRSEHQKHQPSHLSKRVSQEEIDAAKRVNLPDFLMSQGVDLKRVGKEYIMSEHDSVHIKDNVQGEMAKWYQFSEERGGDSISFVRQFLGKDFYDAVKMLNGNQTPELSYDADTITQNRTQRTELQKPEEIHLNVDTEQKRVLAYLSQTRGLNYEMVHGLIQDGKIQQESKTGNAVFLIQDEFGKTVGAEKVGTLSDKKYKGIAVGSASGYGFEVTKGNGENALFFESSIDMLSYMQLHQNELDNHRLISMMGVKPNIVEATMERYHISPERVFLCSDNDEAGNNFAERLQKKYPEMHRLTADSKYKDWNDQLRDIPKTIESPAKKQELLTYGNHFWNDATNNKDKTIFQMRESDFLQHRETLDNAGMNYYAFARNGAVVVAINDREEDKFRELLGNDYAATLTMRKSQKEYTPPNHQIIGNAEYRYIPQKSYVAAPTQTALKIAELLEQENIKFSAKIGRISSTITVSEADRKRVSELKEKILEMRKAHIPKDRQQGKEVSSNQSIQEPSKPDFKDCYYLTAPLQPQEYQEIKPLLESADKIPYSCLLRDEKLVFVVEKSSAKDFMQELSFARNQNQIERDLKSRGISNEQLSELKSSIQDSARSGQTSLIATYIDAAYTPAQLQQLNQHISAYISDNSDTSFLRLIECKSQLDKDVTLSEITAGHDYNEEQKAAIVHAFDIGVPQAAIEQLIDETVSANDILIFSDMYRQVVTTNDSLEQVTTFLSEKKQAASLDSDSKSIESEEKEASDSEQNITDIGSQNIQMSFSDIEVEPENESSVSITDSTKVEELIESVEEENSGATSESAEELQNEKEENDSVVDAESQPYELKIGDKFQNLRTGDICEVVSLAGALPWYEDDCTVKRESGAFVVTENLPKSKLLDTDLYKYIDSPEQLSEIEEVGTVEQVVMPAFSDEKILENPTLMEENAESFPDTMPESFEELPSKIEQTESPTLQDEDSNKEKEQPQTTEEAFAESGITEENPSIVNPEVDSELQSQQIEKLVQDKDSKDISQEFEVEAKPEELQKEQVEKTSNFTITDDNLGEGGAKTKFKANLAAIETLKTLETENRPATEEEKEVLSKYVGWGGMPQAFDSGNEKWAKEYAALRETLTDSEYTSAKASVLDSFYTPPIVIDSIYDAARSFGFEGGNLLEPSCGVGNFIGRMPTDLQKETQIYGVELDSISGRIAKKLYPDADIQIKGFEKTDFQTGSFDMAVGNVPFGDLGFFDKEYGTKQLHDYFFARTLDKVKEGGIVAFVTSTGTLDKANEDFRKQLSEKADLIGAIRMPSGTFSKNAGTDVTSDIIFLQKRSEPPVIEPEWVHIGETDTGLPINQYFSEHPDMVLGEMVEGNKMYGHGTMCVPIEGADLKEQLQEAVSKLSATISDVKANDVYPKIDGLQVTPPEELRNFSLFEQNHKIYFKTTDRCCVPKCNHSNKEIQAARAFISLRDTTRELLVAQEQNQSDDVIRSLQEQLNAQYDSFSKKHGLLHSRANKSMFGEDVSYPLVASLEKSYDLSKGTAEKSDLFTKRTIKPPKAVEHVDTAMEALTISLSEKAKVDIGYMQMLTGETKDELLQELQSEIYLVPNLSGEEIYQTAAEYLSGNIYEKLEAAEKAAALDSRFEKNVQVLKESKPPMLKAEDLDIQIGASWIDPKIYRQFMYETFGTSEEKQVDFQQRIMDDCKKQLEDAPFYKKYMLQKQYRNAESSMKSAIKVTHSERSGEWSITPKPTRYGNLSVHEQEYSTKHKSAYQIMEDLLNLREPKCYKVVVETLPFGETKEKRVIDDKATKAAHLKADKIREAFKEWIFQDPERRNELVEQYNQMFNCIKPREFDGSNLTFPTMNADISLRPHQKDAVAHALFGGNTLFAHCVGAGKTFEMIATAMESKRLGLCSKPMICVPKQLTEQIGEDFRLLYPGANILVATAKDFQESNRKQLFAKIATSDLDAVIISHQQLGRIPISQERQIALLEQQIQDIVTGIKELKEADGGSVEIKALERSRKSLKKRLDKLLDTPKDDTVTFEEMGIDKLIVDEAHEFKNLFTATKLQGVSGISTSSSQKAMDLFLKCQYLDEKTGGKGIVMATGTPLSNSMTELHVMMRYLEHDFLKGKGLDNFDNWISVFGKQQTDWQLNTTGSDVKQKVHMSYTGIPELMAMFKQIADIRTADMLHLDVPECEMHVVQVEPTEEQKDMLGELSDRADALQNRTVTDPRIDNPLKITGDGRKLALDPRLIDPTLEDNPATKLNQCVENVYQIYEETAQDKLTQIIFCDLGVPSGSSPKTTANEEKSAADMDSLEEACDFCVYDDIRNKLIEKGVQPDEIAYIHSAKTEKDKEELFSKVRSGEVRVLLGSTSKMGTGVNVQQKLIAVHDLDIPWRPADMEQRRGRLVRQGNENKHVHQYRYVTKGTFDAYSYQLLESKQNFISQIMTSDTMSRSAEDVDQQALNYSEIKALCIGDERLKQRADMENEVSNMRIQKREHDSRIYDMQDLVAAYPQSKSDLEHTMESLKTDKEHVRSLPIDAKTNRPAFAITIAGTKYTDRKDAADALRNAVFSMVKERDTPTEIGEFMGFPLSVTIKDFGNFGIQENGSVAAISASLSGAAKYTCDFVDSYDTNLRRLESSVAKIDQRIQHTENELNSLEIDFSNAQKILSEPFELLSKDGRTLGEMETALKELTAELAASAAQAKKEAPDKPKTCYFERARMRKAAISAKQEQGSEPKQKKKEQSLD